MSVSMALFPQEPHKKRAKNSKRINSHKQRPTYNEREATSSHSDRSVGATTMTGIFGKRNKVQPASPRDIRRWLLARFSPPAVAKINRLARKAQRSGVDRTAYRPASVRWVDSNRHNAFLIVTIDGILPPFRPAPFFGLRLASVLPEHMPFSAKPL